MKPHKHAELIKAWADGATVQSWIEHTGKWEDNQRPLWLEEVEYRIKQQNLSVAYIVDHKYSVRAPEHWEKPNLTLTFDGETGKLKSAEVI